MIVADLAIKVPKKEQLNIYDVIRPIYVVGRCFGFFPFSMKKDTIHDVCKCEVNFTKKDLFIFAIHLFLYSSLIYINIAYSDIITVEEMSPLLILGIKVGLILALMNAIAFILADLFNTSRIFRTVTLYKDFDMEMQILGCEGNHRLIRRNVYIYIVFVFIVSSFLAMASIWICKDFYRPIAMLITFSSFYFTTSTFVIVISIYSFLIFSVKTRLSFLNKTLRNTLPMKYNDLRMDKTVARHLIKRIMKLADLYDSLNNILDSVNRCYSIQVMLTLAVSFTYTVFSFFSIYRGWIMGSVDNAQAKLSLVLSMWASFYFVFVATLLWAGHSTKNEGKFTGVLVHRAINKCNDPEIIERIVAATTTYLIILIQFDASGYNPMPPGSRNLTG